jgi:hypothetical protein
MPDIPNLLHITDHRVNATENTIGAQTAQGGIVADRHGWTIVYKPGAALRSHSERRTACPTTNLQLAVLHLIDRGTPPALPVNVVLAPAEDNPEVLAHRKGMQA